MSESDLAAEYREALVRALLRNGALHTGAVERAFRRVPRHVFVPEVDLDSAYRDNSIPTKLQGGEVVSSSSQPAIMAIMLEQLALEPGQQVLEVGAGTGYNAGLLSEIVGPGGRVTSIDLDPDTVERARDALSRAGYSRARVEQADGEAGFPEAAPYDRIIATVGLGDIPLALWSQLKTGGHLVLPLSMRGAMKSVAFRKDRHGRLISTAIAPAMFMPLRGVAPLLLREVRLGPELGLYAWSAECPLEGEALYATLADGVFEDIASGIELSRRELGGGLNLWLRAYQTGFVQLHVESALVDLLPVPSFTRSPFAHPLMRDRTAIGVWQPPGELALLSLSGEQSEVAPLGIRAWGGHSLARQLLNCVRAWRQAGSPTDDDLQLQLVPHGERVEAGATIPMSAGTLELTWRHPG